MSTKEFGCFLCEGKSSDPVGRCNICGTEIDISGLLAGAQLGGYRSVEVLGRGFYGWTVRATNGVLDGTLKIVPHHRLKLSEPVPSEVAALASCHPHPNIARFIRHWSEEIELAGKLYKVGLLLFEYVPDAMPLRRFVTEDGIQLSRADVVRLLTGIAAGLARIHNRGLWHNDLHDDNILVRRISADEGSTERYEALLIDFGSAVIPNRLDEPADRSDYFYLAKHIYSVTGLFERLIHDTLTPADREFARRLRLLAYRIGDPNVSRRNIEPMEIIEQLKYTLGACAVGHQRPAFVDMLREQAISFSDPFENTNALTLEPQDVPVLYVNSLGWEEQITKSEVVIVVGPRGCGKTMLFRYLALSSQARPQKPESAPNQVSDRLQKARQVGFLVNCAELRTPFIRSSYKKLRETSPDRADDYCREFINAHFLLEVSRTLAWLHDENLAQLKGSDLKAFALWVSRFLPSVPGVPSVGRLHDAVEILERHSIQLSNLRIPDDYVPSALCRDDLLQQISDALTAVEWLRERHVWFLLDDYSVTVFDPIVLRAYNPVVFRLSSRFRMKISSEGDGPILTDALGRKYREGREFTKINLGEIYFRNTEDKGREFIETIIATRARAVNRGSLERLKEKLGEHPHVDSFGSYVCKLKRKGNAQFHGFGLLCSLCSGDISYVLELFRILVGSDWDTARPIPPARQDELTKRFANRQLEDLRRVATVGPRLHEFATNLGGLLRNYLISSDDCSRPDERLRIEIEGESALTPEAQQFEADLMRYSVLIPIGSGKSRAGLPTRKLVFRRLFAPCFPFSPARRSSIALDVSEYQRWLVDPALITFRGRKGDTPGQMEFGNDDQ